MTKDKLSAYKASVKPSTSTPTPASSKKPKKEAPKEAEEEQGHIDQDGLRERAKTLFRKGSKDEEEEEHSLPEPNDEDDQDLPPWWMQA